MSRYAQPYLRCDKVDGELVLTLMKGGAYGHSLGGRAKVPMGDQAALDAAVTKLVLDARAANQKVGKQADGNS